MKSKYSSIYHVLILLSCILSICNCNDTKFDDLKSKFQSHLKSDSSTEESETMTVPTSCLGLNDGYHYIKLLQDDIENAIYYPILYVYCSNEFVIIDYKQDPDWDKYFNSWIKYHYGVVGPIRNDGSNWSKWFLPDRFTQILSTADDDDDFVSGKYLVSPTCSACNQYDERQLNGEQSAYYMSALAFGCFNPVRGWPACDMDFDSYECKTCSWDDQLTQISSSIRDPTLSWEEAVTLSVKTGVCDFEIRGSDDTIAQSYSRCAAEGEDNINWKPSLGIDGRFCECYKPYHDKKTHITLPTKRLNKKIEKVENSKNDIFNNIAPKEYNDKIEPILIYQTDFEYGTYRITKPGTYIIMEDIEFDFNSAPIGHPSPNNIDDNYYWPLSDDVDLYPGAGEARDPYFLGFFAGITIESDNVLLDLNDFELRMSRPFYYQQPYFSIIELANQAFLPGQGPGFFGSDPVFANNIEIKGGTLGLTSHHGIHGNFNNEIKIHNLNVKNFQTHGIQLNGFNNLVMKDVEIGPSTSRAYLNGNYAHLRLLLPTLKKIADEHADETITFNGRDNAVTMHDLIDKVVTMMDMVLSYVIDGKTYADHDDWEHAVEMFINPTGLSMGAVLYGLFLNYPSAGIFGWHVNDAKSYNAYLENVYVHDLRHAGIEVVGFAQGGRVACNAFNGPLPAKDIFGPNIAEFGSKLYSESEDMVYAQYIGSIISDIHIAMYYWGRDDFDNWAGIPFYGQGDKLIDWALGQHPTLVASIDHDQWGFYCNEDAMFHPAKGLLGMKISGVEGVVMNNVKVYNLQDETPLGSNLCGDLENPRHGLYHFAQQLPYQIGFSMNMVMGVTIDFSTNVKIKDIFINDLYSDTGLTYGFTAWYESTIDVSGELNINNLHAGVSITETEFDYADLPNKAPEACAVRLLDAEDYPLDIKWDDKLDIYQACIAGSTGCLGERRRYTLLNNVVEDDGISVECNNELPFEPAPTDWNALSQSRNQKPLPGLASSSDSSELDSERERKSFTLYGNILSKSTSNTFLVMLGIAIVIVLLFAVNMIMIGCKGQKTRKVNDHRYGTF